MDKIDRAILKELVKNPQKPFQQISEKIGIAPVTAQLRFEKLKKKGAVHGTFAIIDLSKIGFQGKAFLLAKASKYYDAETTIDYMSQIPNVFLISELVGVYDLLAMVVFRNTAEIREIVNKIRSLKAIEKVEISLTDEVNYPLKKEFTDIQLFEEEKTET